MNNGFFLITGTSSGIGKALALNILEKGHTVLGVSRNQSDTLNIANFHHFPFDLTETSKIDQIMAKANEIVDYKGFYFVCLVNNASALEPINPIENCAPEEIESHLSIGLVAPILLTSLFIRKFASKKIRKKIAFISSGAAFTPLAEESIYCTSKAGINMFAQSIGLEQRDRENGFEVISIGPGMVNTPMQAAVRSKSSDEFGMVDFFKQAFQDGKLQEPSQVAEKIFKILDNKYEQGKFISVSDV